MMIGEQPGDQEDRQGRPFVGPAGKLLDKCLEEAETDRRKVYVTNTVKHFSWEQRGKLRIHKKPSLKEIHACRPWLEAELETALWSGFPSMFSGWSSDYRPNQADL
jgi:DNA polymerase